VSLYDLKVGDRVQVFDVNGSRLGQPKGGYDGTVVKMGRKLVTVKYDHGESVFRLETGQANDAYGHQHLRTVEQAAEDLRKTEAMQQLREVGLDVQRDRRRDFSVDTLKKIVEIVKEAS
jgi:hypothetical protein